MNKIYAFILGAFIFSAEAATVSVGDTRLTYDDERFEIVTVDADSYTLSLKVPAFEERFTLTLDYLGASGFAHDAVDFGYTLSPDHANGVFFSEASTDVFIRSWDAVIFSSSRYRLEEDASLMEYKSVNRSWQTLSFDFSNVYYRYMTPGVDGGGTLTIRISDIAAAIPEPGAVPLSAAGLWGVWLFCRGRQRALVNA